MTLDRLVCADRGDVGGVVGCSLVESSVRATVVVVLDVFLEELLELVFVSDDGAVEEFVTECPDPPFGVCVGLRRPRRCSDRGDCGSGEDSVEGSGELSGTIANQEPEPVMVAEAARQVSGGLGGPRAGWVGGDPLKVHLPGANRTWNLRRNALSTQAKSVARMAFDWERMNSDHDGPVRSRVGSIPAVRRIFQTVDAASL